MLPDDFTLLDFLMGFLLEAFSKRVYCFLDL
jgi:hypothetical protein